MPESVKSYREVGQALAGLKDLIRAQGNSTSQELLYIRDKLASLERDSRQEYIRKETFEARFRPVEYLVYGIVAMILTAVIGGIIAVVIK